MNRRRPRFQRVLRIQQRRWLRKLEERVGETHRVIPSWGGSLLLHGLMLVVLAVYLFAGTSAREGPAFDGRFATQLTEDLTSLAPGERAGDPFTTNSTDEPPSLSIEPPRPEDDVINQPTLSVARFAPEFATPELTAPLPEATPLASVNPAVAKRLTRDGLTRPLAGLTTGLFADDLTAPFSGRQEMTRAKMVRREGGTVESEKSVEAGLEWLARHQGLDGGWSLNFQPRCQGDGCPLDQTLDSDTAATGLALLPMLGAGHIHTAKSRYQTHVRKGLAWLVNHQQRDGSLFIGGGRNTLMYSHAIAAMALCEAYGLSADPKLRVPAQKAIDYIARTQNSIDGGWRYRPGQAGDTSVVGWLVFALRSARLAGLKISRNVVRGCKTFLDAATADPSRITYAYLPGGSATPVMTAEGLLSRQYLGWAKDFPPLVKGAAMVAQDLEQSGVRNIYYWYYATQLLHNMQNDDWKLWNVRVRDGLVSMQVTGVGCDRGSWDPNSPQPDTWASTQNRHGAGRLFLTSLSVLTLEVYYRYLPLYQPTDGDPNALTAEEAEVPEEKP
ncbi:MAG: prenyltransferase/squalene oxidase repeat-containing protein [Isosphaeraceae bacterium]